MNKFFKWLCKKCICGIKFILQRTFLFVGFILTWVIPIYLLGSEISYTKTVTTPQKLSFAGLTVVAFCLIKFYGNIKAKISAIKPITKRGLVLQLSLIVLQKSVYFTIIFFILKYLYQFADVIFKWYEISLIFIGMGLICYLIDRIIVYYKERKIAKMEREKLKNEIKTEIANGK